MRSSLEKRLPGSTPRPIVASEILVGFDRADFRDERLQVVATLRHDHADGFIRLEPYGVRAAVNFQFIVNVAHDESDSTMPSKG